MEIPAGYTHQVSGNVMPLGSKLTQIHAHPWLALPLGLAKP